MSHKTATTATKYPATPHAATCGHAGCCQGRGHNRGQGRIPENPGGGEEGGYVPRAGGVGVELDSITIRRGGQVVVDNLTARIPAGRVTAVVGPNGAGKTTLLDAILGFRPCGGQVGFSWEGGDTRRKMPRIGYVPQRFAFDRGLPMTPVELIAAGEQRLPLWFGTRQRQRRRAMELLAAVGAERVAERRLGGLSGGELQRVLLAVALRRDPELLILDEPGAGVDAAGEELFCEVLEKLRRVNGFTQLMVSHNLSLVVAHAERVILMNRRLVAAGTPAATLAPEFLQTAFGVHMGTPTFCWPCK